MPADHRDHLWAVVGILGILDLHENGGVLVHQSCVLSLEADVLEEFVVQASGLESVLSTVSVHVERATLVSAHR